jgi:hypothetical protein
MSKEMEYYEQFGGLSCSDPEDTPGDPQAEDSSSLDAEGGSSDTEDESGRAAGETARPARA